MKWRLVEDSVGSNGNGQRDSVTITWSKVIVKPIGSAFIPGYTFRASKWGPRAKSRLESSILSVGQSRPQFHQAKQTAAIFVFSAKNAKRIIACILLPSVRYHRCVDRRRES